MADSTFSLLTPPSKRDKAYEDYRKEWDRRGDELDPGLAPVHLDLECSAICDLGCEFCQIHSHKHIRTKGFKEYKYKPGLMDPPTFQDLMNDAWDLGIDSVKLNYRGEASLHPEIVGFVRQASNKFVDVLLNTNGNGGARKNPDLFAEIVDAGITSLMFSVDACDEKTYTRQRVGGDWNILLNSVDSAVQEKNASLNPNCRIRASIVRTKLNASDVDSGRMQDFWLEQGVDYVSVNECYYPAGVEHPWAAATWTPMSPEQFQCPDPFRRMVVTWDLQHTFPCCQGFTSAVDGGPIHGSILEPYHSREFNLLRNAHISKTWDTKVPMCRTCPLTHRAVKNRAETFEV